MVFVIDGVEGFLKAAKQTLLYNLLDALTSSKVQVSDPKDVSISNILGGGGH